MHNPTEHVASPVSYLTLPDSPPDREYEPEKLSKWIIMPLLLAIPYLIALPEGLKGLIFALIPLLIAIPLTNVSTLGVYFILFGPYVLGSVLKAFGINHAGAIVSLLLGFLLLAISKVDFTFPRVRWRAPLAWLGLTILVLVVFYFRGPQTEYCQSKLLMFTFNVTVTIIALRFLMGNPGVSMWQLGLLGILSSIATYGAYLYGAPELTPSDIFQTAGIRVMIDETDTLIATNTIALIGGMGIVLLLGDLVTDIYSKKYFIISVITIIIGMMVLNSVGQRLFIAIPIFAAGSLVLLSKKNKIVIGIYFILIIGIIGSIVMSGMYLRNDYVTTVFDSEKDISENLNRAINWEAGVELFNEKPFYGHGLGGYYISGYSYPGSGTYAHNLILELLSETGLVGTTIILLPVLVFFLFPKIRNLGGLRTSSGGALIPLLILAFLHSMVSHDLTMSSTLFAILAVMWAHLSPAPERWNPVDAQY